MQERSLWIAAVLTALALVLAAPVVPGQVLVNEVYTGDPDFIEIANFGPSPVDISGWKLDASFGFSVYPTFVFPSGTVIGLGEFFLVIENSASLPATVTPPPAGTITFHTQFGYGWVGTSSGSVQLSDATNHCIDLVKFGTMGVLAPPVTTPCSFENPLDRSTNNVSVDDVIARTSNLDSDDGADWTNGPDGTETPGAVNPGQSLGPPVAKALILDTGPSAVWVQNATTGALSVSGIVAAVEVDGGILLTDPTVDPLIGAAVTINASAFGGNPQTLLNTLLAGTVLQIALADGSGAVQLTASFQSQGSADWHLGGSLGATPIPTRPVTSMSSISTLVTGNASPLLSSLVAPLGNETLSLLVALEPGGKRLAAIERSFALEANPAFLSRLANDGQGGLEVGVIGAQGSELWNVFAVNSSFAPAAGPFFGIDFGPIQYALAVLPIGTVPFHVVPDPGGVHHFRTPINFVPIGWVVDHIAVEQRQGLTVASPFTRVYF